MQIPALILSGDLEAGLRHATWMWDRWQQAGRSPSGWVIPAVAMAALAHQLRGDQHAHATWRTRALQVAGATGPRREPILAPLVFLDARTAIHTRNTAAAATLVTHAFGDFPLTWAQPYAQAAGAELAVVAELPDAAERLTAAASAAHQNRWAAACLARAAGRLHHNPAKLTAAADEWERIGARLERAYTLLLLPDQPRPRHATQPWRARQRPAQNLAHPAQTPLLPLAGRATGQSHPRPSDPRASDRVIGGRK
jgi:hypothetical protein